MWIHWRRVPGGALLLASGRLVRLNRVAAAVWEEIDRTPDREAIHRRMRRRYRGVDDATLRREIDALIDRWIERDWVARLDDSVFPFHEEP